MFHLNGSAFSCGAVIAEFDPFHEGHAYLLSKIRSSNDAVIVIQSGNYVQRGSSSIMRKHMRAKSAVMGGADLVLELPVPYCMAGAQRFAFGGVAIADKLGICDELWFGSECGDVNELSRIADALLTEQYAMLLRAQLDSGATFAKARENALTAICNIDGKTLSSPNNILAIEYIYQLKMLKSNIVPRTVTRLGDSHGSEDVHSTYPSASALRKALLNGDDSPLLPFVRDIWEQEKADMRAPMSLKNGESAFLHALRSMSPKELAQIYEADTGIAYRIVDCANNADSIDTLYATLSTKQYTDARLRRACLAAFLGIKASDLAAAPEFTRVLAFNDTGRTVLKALSETSKINVNVKMADGDASDISLKADRISSLLFPKIASASFDFTSSPIYLRGTHK